jgi:hypothetical protein
VGTARARRVAVVVGLGIGAFVGAAVPAGAAGAQTPFPSATEMCTVDGRPAGAGTPFPTAPGTPPTPPPATVPCDLLEAARRGDGFPWGKVAGALAVPALLVSMGLREMRRRW